MEDELETCVLGSIGGPVREIPPDVLARQLAEKERHERQHDEYLAREEAARREGRDDGIRQNALHGALCLDYPHKDAEVVLTAARQIEAFLRGEATQAHQH